MRSICDRGVAIPEAAAKLRVTSRRALRAVALDLKLSWPTRWIRAPGERPPRRLLLSRRFPRSTPAPGIRARSAEGLGFSRSAPLWRRGSARRLPDRRRRSRGCGRTRRPSQASRSRPRPSRSRDRRVCSTRPPPGFALRIGSRRRSGILVLKHRGLASGSSTPSRRAARRFQSGRGGASRPPSRSRAGGTATIRSSCRR